MSRRGEAGLDFHPLNFFTQHSSIIMLVRQTLNLGRRQFSAMSVAQEMQGEENSRKGAGEEMESEWRTGDEEISGF